jgi:hypothetical protein
MHGVLGFLLGLRAIMLIGSAGAMVGALLMFLQGSSFLYHAWHDFFAASRSSCPYSRPSTRSCSALSS